MANAKELKVTYVGDATALKRTLGGIESAHRSFASRLGSVAKTVGKGVLIAGAAGAVALAGMAKAAISAASAAQQVSAQTEAVLESTGRAANVTAGEVSNLANEIMAYSGISDEAVQAGENMLLTFTNIRNRVGEGNDIFGQAVTVLADMSVALGRDMKSQAIQLGKALNDPVKGISALTRVGVAFTQAQKEQIAAMVEAGDVAGAQKVILAELAKEFGGSAKAAGKTFAGQMNIMKEQVGNALEEVGGRLLKVGVKIIPTISKTFTGLVKTVGPVLGDFFASISGTVTELLPAIAPILATLGEAIGKVLEALGPTLAQVIEALAPILGEVALALADVLIALLPLIPPLVELIEALAPLIPMIAAIVVALVKLLVPALKVVIKAIAAVARFVVGFVTKWETAWDAVKTTALRVWEVIRSAAARIWDGIQTVILDPIRTVKDVIVDVWQKIRETLRGIWGGMKETAINIWNGLVEGIKVALNVAIDAINFLIRHANRVSGALDFALGPTFNWPDIPQIPALHAGGTIRRAGLAVVGDRGPELVRLSRGAQVVPLGGRGSERLRVELHVDRRRFTRAQELEYAGRGW